MSDPIDLTPFRVQYSNYARQLLSDLGLSGVEEPLRGQLLSAIEQYISQVLTNTILSNLDDTAIEGIDTMLKEGKEQEEVITYLVASIPGIDKKIATALEKSYDKLLKETQQLTNEVSDHYLAPKKTEDSSPEAAEAPTDTLPDQEPVSVPSGIDENPTPESSTDTDSNAANPQTPIT